MSEVVAVIAVFVLVGLGKSGSNLGKPQYYPTTASVSYLPVVR